MDVAQTPGWARYIFGGFDGDGEVGARFEVWCCVEVKRETKGWVEGREEVRARTSVRRLDDSYACGEERPWRSSLEKSWARASRLEIQIIRPCFGDARARSGARKCARR